MGLGEGKTEHSGPRDMARKEGHWGFTEEAKEFATRARRRDEKELLRREADAEYRAAADARWRGPRRAGRAGAQSDDNAIDEHPARPPMP